MSGFREGRKEGEWEILLREVGSLGELEEDTAVSAAGVLLRWGQMRKGKKAVQPGIRLQAQAAGAQGLWLGKAMRKCRESRSEVISISQ